ncbi:50S ribosomal protein L33 [Neobacillus dielmonensis]|nr:50S ribosomal protein L33 [Neobacillus dielmonensis]
MSKKTVLACTVCGSRNYSTVSSKEVQTDRLELKKFCKTCGVHTIHRETK